VAAAGGRIKRLDGMTNSYRFSAAGRVELEGSIGDWSTCEPYELGPAMLSMLSVSDMVSVIWIMRIS